MTVSDDERAWGRRMDALEEELGPIVPNGAVGGAIARARSSMSETIATARDALREFIDATNVVLGVTVEQWKLCYRESPFTMVIHCLLSPSASREWTQETCAIMQRNIADLLHRKTLKQCPVELHVVYQYRVRTRAQIERLYPTLEVAMILDAAVQSDKPVVYVCDGREVSGDELRGMLR